MGEQSGIGELQTALRYAQAAITSLEHDARNEFAGFDYVSSERIIEEARRVLLEHGLVICRLGYTFTSANEVGEGSTLSTFSVMLPGVAAMEIQWPFPYVVGKGKPLDKAIATSLTTGLAYFLRDLLMIPRKGADDDMNVREDAHEPQRAVINPDQWIELNDLLKETMTDERAFLDYFSVPTLKDLPSKSYTKALAMLKEKQRRASSGKDQ